MATENTKTEDAGKEKYCPEDIGVCEVRNGMVVRLKKEAYGQGFVFKSWAAFRDAGHPNRPCYVPELEDDITPGLPGYEPEPAEDICWARQDILDLCDGDAYLAAKVFENADWASPATVLEQMEVDGEVGSCPSCGKKFADMDSLKCPHCGAEYRRRYYVTVTSSAIVYAKDIDEANERGVPEAHIEETEAYILNDDGSLVKAS